MVIDDDNEQEDDNDVMKEYRDQQQKYVASKNLRKDTGREKKVNNLCFCTNQNHKICITSTNALENHTSRCMLSRCIILVSAKSIISYIMYITTHQFCI